IFFFSDLPFDLVVNYLCSLKLEQVLCQKLKPELGSAGHIPSFEYVCFVYDRVSEGHLQPSSIHPKPRGFRIRRQQGSCLAFTTELIAGLRQHSLLPTYTHLLTGYCGDASFLREIAKLAKELKSVTTEFQYVCDPVLGDEGVLYVPKDLIEIYRHEVLKVADIITPNQFEVELLTGLELKDEKTALEALKLLHNMGPRTVVLTSLVLDPNAKTLKAYGSVKDETEVVTVEVPRLAGRFTGTGDVFAAVFLAHHSRYNGDMKKTLAKAMQTMERILSRTAAAAQIDKRNIPAIGLRELRIVESIQDIVAFENFPPALVDTISTNCTVGC
ncbi:unnamed protein product, partial [Cyprideis torosa]